jgi:hypothetical protein
MHWMKRKRRITDAKAARLRKNPVGAKKHH